ncbi:UNVERIFIED_CONTAM: hypothetical protein FKN15_047513 [Acipenser sinensis]
MAELQKEESVQLYQEDADNMRLSCTFIASIVVEVSFERAGLGLFKGGSTAGEAKADHEESNIQQCDEGKEAEDATNKDPKDESGASNTSTSSTAAREKHISIQAQLTDLENLTDLDETGKKLCPLCSEEKFKACYNHKLQRHLQNLHWKVSVEFEGRRMCICHLPCRQLKPSLNGDECSSRLGAHYHCIVCSATVSRRTDMISHLKRHVNKGETEASYTGVSGKQSFCEILKESDTNVQVLPNCSTPQNSDSYFSCKMKTNRQLVFCALAVLSEEHSPLECLDAFGATGIMGLQWAQHLCSAVKVTINDISETSVKMIRENCHLNHMRVQGENDDSEEEELDEEPFSTIEVTKMDANVLMHLRAFDFIHLDPYGTAVHYLDAAFRNVRNLGIVSVTSTDTSSLYSKTLNVTLRHYSCRIVRTEYYKELAARMVIATVARVVFAVAYFLAGKAYIVNSTKAIEIGKKFQFNTFIDSTAVSMPTMSVYIVLERKRKMQEGAANVLKRMKSEVPVEHPAFYYSIHRHSIQGMNMPKLNKFLQYLMEAGFRVSRTHFDPTGVRTDATLDQFKSVLTKYSVPTYTTVQTGGHSHISEEVKLDVEFTSP